MKNPEAYKSLEKIEKLLDVALDMWYDLPTGVQDAIANVHGEHHNLHHCLRWGLQAVQEVREKEEWEEIMAVLDDAA